MSPLQTGPSRRQFLHTVAASLVALPLLSACGESDDSIDGTLPATEFDPLELATAYFGADGIADARAIGGRYHDAHGTSEAVDNDLSALLTPVADRTDISAVVAEVNAALSADFAAGEMVSVAGWQLGRTEARMCGLAYQVA